MRKEFTARKESRYDGNYKPDGLSQWSGNGGTYSRRRGKTAITTRWCFKLREETGRGWGEVGSDGGKWVYGTLGIYGGMAYRLFVVESSGGKDASMALCCTRSH